MLQALVLMNRKRHSEAIRVALPLYGRAPHRQEEFADRDWVSPGVFPLPVGFTSQWTVAQVLGRAMFGDGQYNTCLALTAGIHFREHGVTLRRDSVTVANMALLVRGSGKDLPIAVTVNDLWVDFRPKPVSQEQCLFVPVAQLAPHLGFETDVANEQARIELRREQPPAGLVFEEGKGEVVVDGGENLTLEHAPFRRKGKLMVPAAEVAKLLMGEVHWYPEVRFMHLIIPKPKPKDEPAEQ